MTDLTESSFDASPLAVAILLFMDFADEPVRVALAPMPIGVPAAMTGDADADGEIFDVANSDVLSIGSFGAEEGGSDALAISLTASPLNAEMMNRIDDASLYAGRSVKIWTVLHDGGGTVIEARRVYNGTMIGPEVTTSSTAMIATMACEGFAALLAAPPARTWQMQKAIDPDDESADAASGSGNSLAAIGLAYAGSVGVMSDRQYEQLK